MSEVLDKFSEVLVVLPEARDIFRQPRAPNQTRQSDPRDQVRETDPGHAAEPVFNTDQGQAEEHRSRTDSQGHEEAEASVVRDGRRTRALPTTGQATTTRRQDPAKAARSSHLRSGASLNLVLQRRAQFPGPAKVLELAIARWNGKARF